MIKTKKNLFFFKIQLKHKINYYNFASFYFCCFFKNSFEDMLYSYMLYTLLETDWK
jgi:hypothetical protein